MDLPDNVEILDFYNLYNRFRKSRVGLVRSNEFNIRRAEKCPEYWATNQVLHERSARELKQETDFQKWLRNNESYKNSIGLLQKKHVVLIMKSGDVMQNELYSQDDEKKWRIQYIFACAMLAYKNPSEIVGLNLDAEGLVGRPALSQRTINAANKFLKYLDEDMLNLSRYFRKRLESICDGRMPPQPYVDGTMSEQQRKKVVIREIAIKGQRLILPARTKKGRFPPDIAVSVADLFYPGIDKRSVELYMEPYDLANQERAPFTVSEYVVSAIERYR